MRERAMSLFPDLPRPEPMCDIAARVFSYWQQVTGHTRGRMDRKREELITQRLKDGYSEADLKLAAKGISQSGWHQGQNPDRKIYDSVELCFRNADKVDQFIREGEAAELREKRRVASDRERAQHSIERSTVGPVYREQRDNLLRLVGKKEAA